jgi:hypothetical protein
VRLVGGTPVQATTTVGGAPQVAEQAIESLTKRLLRWDLGNDDGPLRRVWRGRDLVEVDDETLLLLALTTNATPHILTDPPEPLLSTGCENSVNHIGT